MTSYNDDNPLSYWLATAPAFEADAPLPDRAQVVVVGGGVFGACAALHLARAGADVLLVERGGLASGATGRNAGILSPGTTEDYLATRAQLGTDTARAVWAFTEDGAAGLRALLAEEGIDADFRAEGSYTAALSAEEAAAHQATVEQLARDGFALDWFDRDALQARVGTPLAPTWRGARFNPRGGVLHSGQMVRGVARAAVRHGARVAQGVAVADVRGGVVQTDQGDIQADEVVLTTNAYTGSVYPGLAGVIEPVRGKIRATVPLAQCIFPGA
ncbi:MAG: FAD-binding oxidoreductase, partial [Anaerolineae bacterium]|nr:FAD-binding oxidoreductase [Anaerolineae bacterium]